MTEDEKVENFLIKDNKKIEKFDIAKNTSIEETIPPSIIENNISNIKIENESSQLSFKEELFYLGINALSVVMNGVNHFHFKYMKLVCKDGYDEYSFTIWRCCFILMTNKALMVFKNEHLEDFDYLKNLPWFWIRVVIQFITLQSMLLLISFFRVSTATCFISMAPLAIVIMSSLLLKEKFYMRYVYGVFICFFGVLLIVNNEKKDTKKEEYSFMHLLVGFMLGLSQLFCVAIHRVSSKFLIKFNISINTQLMYPTFFCIVFSIFFIPILGREFKYGGLLIWHSFLNNILWLLCTSLTLFSFKGIDLIKTTAIGYINIITVFILGVLFLGESVYFTDVLGSMIILVYNIYNTIYPPYLYEKKE